MTYTGKELFLWHLCDPIGASFPPKAALKRLDARRARTAACSLTKTTLQFVDNCECQLSLWHLCDPIGISFPRKAALKRFDATSKSADCSLAT